jgi:hypothetical protein
MKLVIMKFIFLNDSEEDDDCEEDDDNDSIDSD